MSPLPAGFLLVGHCDGGRHAALGLRAVDANAVEDRGRTWSNVTRGHEEYTIPVFRSKFLLQVFWGSVCVCVSLAPCRFTSSLERYHFFRLTWIRFVPLSTIVDHLVLVRATPRYAKGFTRWLPLITASPLSPLLVCIHPLLPPVAPLL